MHEIAKNFVRNAQNLAAGAPPQTPPLEELTTLPQWAGKGKPNSLRRHLLLNPFGVLFRRLQRLKSNVPLPKQFSGSAPAQTPMLCSSAKVF